MKNLIVLIISLFLFSCGKKAETSKSNFKIFSSNMTSGTSMFTGGVLIMGRSLDGEQSFKTAYSANLEFELKKGTWEFATIGWIGANPMEGNQLCAYQKVKIDTDDFTVTFNMNYQNCLNQTTMDGKYLTSSIFYNNIGNNYNGFKKLQVKTCANLDNCNQFMPHSFRVEIPSELKGVKLNTGYGKSLVSQCISGTSDSNITPPHGGPKGFLELKLTTFGNDVAKFNSTRGMAFDSFGNMFATDWGNNTIRKITPEGVVSTFAGLAGTYGSTDGLGSAARFNYPNGLAIDSSNNLYVTDKLNHTIRKISPAGLVSTFAGTPLTSGSVDGSVTNAKFNSPTGITIDSSNNIYIADTSNQTIRKITPVGIVTTLAGFAGSGGSTNGTGYAARFDNPEGITVDSIGNIYVADTDNYSIRKVSAAGVVTTLAGQAGNVGHTDGTGSAARFYQPPGIVIDTAGNLYTTDLGNMTIRKITSNGVVTTIAGTAGSSGNSNGTGSAARFSAPWGLSIDSSDNLYVNDGPKIRKVTPGGVVTTFAGINASGSDDGLTTVADCSGSAKNYLFNHGFGEILNQSYFDGGNYVTRRGALLVDVSSIDMSLALAPLNFQGTYSNPDSLPSQIGSNDLYHYVGMPMSISPNANDGDYIYYNGMDWINFPESESVKLLLEN